MLLIALLFSVLLLTGASAQAATTSYVCKFVVEASPKGLAKQASPFELRYVVDSSGRKAYLMGNAGSSEVEIIPNADGTRLWRSPTPATLWSQPSRIQVMPFTAATASC
jgi:hypothetical protein